MNINDFATGVEKMIDPIKVGSTHYAQKRLCHLPKFLQRKIILSESRKIKKMGFVVEPYATFLFFRLSNYEAVAKYLPDNFIPAQSCVFCNECPSYYGAISLFRVHTSMFWGSRAEFYIISKNTQTNLTSWVIADYISDTISYDKVHGLRAPDVDYAIITTTCDGTFTADIREKDGKRLYCNIDLNSRIIRNLDEQLWINGNTSIAYGKNIGGCDGDLFSLTFLPDEMHEAWEIPLCSIRQFNSDWMPELFSGEIARCVCFPYAQHMISDTPGTSTHYSCKEELQRAAEDIEF